MPAPNLPVRTAPLALRAAQQNRPNVKIHLLDGDTVQGRIEQVLDDGSVMLEKPGPVVSLVPYHAVAEFEFVS